MALSYFVDHSYIYMIFEIYRNKVTLKHWDSVPWHPPPKWGLLLAQQWPENTDSVTAVSAQVFWSPLGNSFKVLPHSFEYLNYLHLWKEDVIYGNGWITRSQVWQGGQDGWCSLELPILDKSAVRVFSAMTGLFLSVKIKQFIILKLTAEKYT